MAAVDTVSYCLAQVVMPPAQVTQSSYQTHDGLSSAPARLVVRHPPSEPRIYTDGRTFASEVRPSSYFFIYKYFYSDLKIFVSGRCLCPWWRGGSRSSPASPAAATPRPCSAGGWATSSWTASRWAVVAEQKIY